jgi:hypothetical protein
MLGGENRLEGLNGIKRVVLPFIARLYSKLVDIQQKVKGYEPLK